MSVPPEISDLFEAQVRAWLAFGLDRRLRINRREFRAWYIDPLREHLHRFKSEKITETELPFLLVFPERFGVLGGLQNRHGERINLASLRDTTQPYCPHCPYLAIEVHLLVMSGTEVFDRFCPIHPTAAEIIAASLTLTEEQHFVLHGSRFDKGDGYGIAPLLTRRGRKFILELDFYPDTVPDELTYTAITIGGRLC